MDYSCHNPFDSVAQLVEQRTFNPWVAGSSPARVIITDILKIFNKTLDKYPVLCYNISKNRRNINISSIFYISLEIKMNIKDSHAKT